MPTLEWIGKDKVINHHQQVPYRVLEEKYTYSAEKSDNMIIRGDNLEALKALLPKYEGRIKCIYIDPPYNTGNEGWVYNDNVNDPKIRKWLGEVVGKEGEDLSRHDKWLCMMYPRLKLLQRLLSVDGVIFISIDDTEYANLKCICDEYLVQTALYRTSHGNVLIRPATILKALLMKSNISFAIVSSQTGNPTNCHELQKWIHYTKTLTMTLCHGQVTIPLLQVL